MSAWDRSATRPSCGRRHSESNLSLPDSVRRSQSRGPTGKRGRGRSLVGRKSPDGDQLAKRPWRRTHHEGHIGDFEAVGRRSALRPRSAREKHGKRRRARKGTPKSRRPCREGRDRPTRLKHRGERISAARFPRKLAKECARRPGVIIRICSECRGSPKRLPCSAR